MGNYHLYSSLTQLIKRRCGLHTTMWPSGYVASYNCQLQSGSNYPGVGLSAHIVALDSQRKDGSSGSNVMVNFPRSGFILHHGSALDRPGASHATHLYVRSWFCKCVWIKSDTKWHCDINMSGQTAHVMSDKRGGHGRKMVVRVSCSSSNKI